MEAFLEAESSPDVLDPAPEQLSQTVDTVGGGTSEIQKNIIARRGLGLPAS